MKTFLDRYNELKEDCIDYISKNPIAPVDSVYGRVTDIHLTDKECIVLIGGRIKNIRQLPNEVIIQIATTMFETNSRRTQ